MIRSTTNAPSRSARFARVLDWLGLLDRLLWLRARLHSRVLTVVTYHRVGRAGQDELDPSLVEVEPDELAAQLEVIKAHGTVVTLDDIAPFRGSKRLPPNPVLITFDDGYADNHATALPILQRAGVPAAFFIPTAFPDAGRLFWWDRVFLCTTRSRRSRIRLGYPARLDLDLTADRGAAARAVCNAIKRTPNLDLVRLWEELERATGVSLSREEERQLAEKAIMGWREIRALRAAGMDVQSHSHNHLVLNTLSPTGAQRDLERSNEMLGEAVGRRASSVAYPVGYSLDGALRRAPQDARFELGFTNATGLCFMDRFDPMNVPRVSMDLTTGGSLYKLLLLLGDDPVRTLRGTPRVHRAAVDPVVEA